MRILLPSVLLAACGTSSTQAPSDPDNEAGAAGAANVAEAPLNLPAPGTTGALPDERTPVSEALFSEASAQGAASVLQSYFRADRGYAAAGQRRGRLDRGAAALAHRLNRDRRAG